MSKYYKKFSFKDNNGIRPYGHKKSYHQKRNQYYHINNNYNTYVVDNRRKKMVNDTYEEEFSYDRETTVSNNPPSTRDDSFSQSSKSNSRNQSYIHSNKEIIEYNSKDESNFNKDNQLKIVTDFFPKINLSENELKTAYFKPKNFKENSLTKNENKKDENQKENENISILDVTIRINGKKILFNLRKYDDMFKVAREACNKNELSEEYVDFIVFTMIKALNSIYGIFNLELKEEEIKIIQNLKQKEKCGIIY